jgi:hypothetical protein
MNSSLRHAPTALYPGQRIPIPIGEEAKWALELVLTHRIEKKIIFPFR